MRDRGIAVGVAYAAAIAVVAWPFRTLEPGVGGDWFWVGALSYAAEHGLRFGQQLIFSYGPLGFLNTWYGPRLYYGDVLLLSWLFAALIQLLLAGTLLVALRRSLPVAAAAVVAVVVLVLAPDRVSALGFAWCVLALTRPADAPRDPFAAAFPFAIGVLAGVAVLGKLNQGIELVLLALVALAVVALDAAPRRRDPLAFAGALLATAAVGWLATGQALSDVWPYLRNGVEVVTGYAAAMGTSDPPHRWAYAGAVAIAALALALAWDATRRAPSRRRWGLIALCVVYIGFNFKEGFVRQDGPHVAVFFGDLLVLLAVLPMRPSRRPLLLGSIAAGVVALGAISGARELARTVNPYANAKAVGDQLRTLATPSRQAALTSRLRAEIASGYGIAPQLIGAIGRRSVLLWPFAYGDIAYAYDLRLRPLPALEPYASYTPALDRLGAKLLASARAPQRIMRASVPGIDGRNATFESPLATLGIFCRYRQIVSAEPWQVLARANDRCGAQRALRTATARWGEPVPVPDPARPGALVLARIDGAGPQGLEHVQALLVRPSRRWISLDGTRYRLVAATAADGLLLHAPRGTDYPGPFAMAANPVSIAVGRDGSEPGGQLRYTFVEVPVRPFPRGASAR